MLIFPVNPFPNKPWFLRVGNSSLLKTLWEKEKLIVTSNFSFSRSDFYPFGELFAIFIKFETVICTLPSLVWKSLNFVVWERVKFVRTDGQTDYGKTIKPRSFDESSELTTLFY